MATDRLISRHEVLETPLIKHHHHPAELRIAKRLISRTAPHYPAAMQIQKCREGIPDVGISDFRWKRTKKTEKISMSDNQSGSFRIVLENQDVVLEFCPPR